MGWTIASWVGSFALFAFTATWYARQDLPAWFRKAGWWSAGALVLLGVAWTGSEQRPIGSGLPLALAIASILLVGTVVQAGYFRADLRRLNELQDENPKLAEAMKRNALFRFLDRLPWMKDN